MMSTNNTFNPKDHLITIKNRGGAAEYLPVQWRLVWFRQLCPEGEITTELLHLDLEKEMEEESSVWKNGRSEKVTKMAKGFAVFRATVKDGKGGIATGTGSESAVSFGDFIEKAETKSVGRALAALGYGTQFTGDEFNEAHRIVDSPVDPPHEASQNGQERPATSEANQGEPLATLTQINAIANLYRELGKKEESMDTLTRARAGKLFNDLKAEKHARATKAS